MFKLPCYLTESAQNDKNARLLIMSTATLICGCYAAAQPAFAYGDLTTASYISQIILGTIFGGTLSVRTLWKLFAGQFRRQAPAAAPVKVTAATKIEKCRTMRGIPSLSSRKAA